MNNYNKYELVLVVLTLGIAPDFLMRISGRDSLFSPSSSFVVNVEILLTLLMVVLVCVRICNAVYHRKYKLALHIVTITLLVTVIYIELVDMLTTKSITEAKSIVSRFIVSGENNTLSVNIDTDAEAAYDMYLKKEKSAGDLQLVAKSPHFRIYEFKVSHPGVNNFRIRVTVRQAKLNEIWIHM